MTLIQFYFQTNPIYASVQFMISKTWRQNTNICEHLFPQMIADYEHRITIETSQGHICFPHKLHLVSIIFQWWGEWISFEGSQRSRAHLGKSIGIFAFNPAIPLQYSQISLFCNTLQGSTVYSTSPALVWHNQVQNLTLVRFKFHLSFLGPRLQLMYILL